jgi:S1-C subfamily serine protease
VIDFLCPKAYSIAMEHLTKQQIVLLTLLVSFMTSIATGIVTVSLINQAPAGTTNTIERVIEDSVAAALPSSNLAAVGQPSSGSGGSLTAAIGTIGKSIVKIGEYGSNTSNSGLGIVVNSHGTVMTDKSVIAGLNKIAIAYPNGHSYGAAPIEAQSNGDIVFLQPFLATDQSSLASATSTASFNPVSIADFPKLGETIVSLGGALAGILGVGIVDEIVTGGASSTPSAVSTTIALSKVMPGSPLFNIAGNLIGLRTSSLSSASGTQFYLIAPIKAAIPK